MIEVKRVEIRDAGTTIPALALRLTGGRGDRILWRAGYGEGGCILLVHLASPRCEYDAYSWDRSRTMARAHLWLEDHFDEQVDGGVLDVEFILGETAAPKEPEC